MRHAPSAAAARGAATAAPFIVSINGRPVARDLDVAATAGGEKRAVDLVFDGIEPVHGLIEVRFKGIRRAGADGAVHGEAFIQALEVGPGPGGEGARPVSASVPPPSGNLLVNPGFEAAAGGVLGASRLRTELAGWICEFLGPHNGYSWQEADYSKHPDWGAPEIRTGKGAIRTHGDGIARNLIFQEVEVEPSRTYAASVWARTADVRGKGFGRDPRDLAALIIEELDGKGAVVRQHAGAAALKDAGPYRQIAVRFTTGATTAAVRFVLDAAIHCRYEEGHVTFDDAALTADPATPGTGSGKR